MKRLMFFLLLLGLATTSCQKQTCPAFEHVEHKKKKKPKKKKELYRKDKDLFGNKR